MEAYEDGKLVAWMEGIVVHADRGPGKCMAKALALVFPFAIFRSCAFHVWKAMFKLDPSSL